MIKNENEFKLNYRQDKCTGCEKKRPCYELDSICKLVTPCVSCEIKDSCTKLCPQMDAYLKRGNCKVFVKNLPVYMDNISKSVDTNLFIVPNIDNLPWGCLSPKTEKIVKDRFLNNMSFAEMSKKYKIKEPTIYDTIFGRPPNRKGAIKRLKHYADMQKNITKFKNSLPEKHVKLLNMYYFEFKTIEQVKKACQNDQDTVNILKEAKKTINKLIKKEQNEKI
jgi:hypothetical protein